MSASLIGRSWICASCRRYAVANRRSTPFAPARALASQSQPQPEEKEEHESSQRSDISPHVAHESIKLPNRNGELRRILDVARRLYRQDGNTIGDKDGQEVSPRPPALPIRRLPTKGRLPMRRLKARKASCIRKVDGETRNPVQANHPPVESRVETDHSGSGPISSKQQKAEAPAQTHQPRKDANLPGPDIAVRTRFAPSPTGDLHIGGLRTALFSYLLARRCGGKFVLRIEDTDQKRLVPGAEQRLMDDLRWAGLQWDEGPDINGPFGSYRQSERTEIYQVHARQLLDNGTAYRCFCPPQAAGEAGAKYVTSGCYGGCNTLSSEESHQRAQNGIEPFTVRLHRPRDAAKRKYPDLVHRSITPVQRRNTSLADGDQGTVGTDTILIKSDGTPTYHFANVVDDHLMQITHVIRGDEWMASTPLHYDLYAAFGWTPPQFAHVCLLVDANGAKLSKRNAEMGFDVASMRDEEGIHPEVLINFLVLFGWSSPSRKDILSMEQLIASFDLKFTKGTAQVRREKLEFLRRAHLAEHCRRARDLGQVDDAMQAVLGPITAEVIEKFPQFVPPERQPFEREPSSRQHEIDPLTQYCAEILSIDVSNYQNAAQFVERHRYYFERPPPTAVEHDDVDAAIESMLLHYDYLRPYDAVPGPNFIPDDWMHGEQLRMEETVAEPTFKMRIHRLNAALTRILFESASETCFHSVQDRQQLMDLFPNLPTYPLQRMFEEWIFEAAGFGPHSSNPVDAGHFRSVRKHFSSRIMTRLRARLMNGAPGPSAHEIPAILGYRETCERLSLKPAPERWPGAGSGWEARKLADDDALARWTSQFSPS